MHDVLDGVYRHKNITNGVLRITSNGGSGLIGVFCGRFLTGAVLTLTGESGYTALKRLLSVNDGTFAFMDAQRESLPDLRQSLGVDIAALLSLVDLSSGELPLSEEALTSMKTRVSTEELELFDTSVDLAEEQPPLDEASRIDRITKTYDRLFSLSAYQRAQNVANEASQSQLQLQPQIPAHSHSQPEWPTQPNSEIPAGLSQQERSSSEGSLTPTMPLPHPMSLHSSAKDEMHEQLTAGSKTTQYNRLKGWSMSDKGTTVGTIIALALVWAIGYAVVTFWPHLLHP